MLPNYSMNSREVLNIKDTLTKAKSLNYNITEYTLRRAIKEGALPCRIVGRTYLIAWTNFERWLFCCDSSDNKMCESPETPEFVHFTSSQTPDKVLCERS